jgi:two-component system, LuxR family, sensor kinase FixL
MRQSLKGDLDHFHTEKRYLHKRGHMLWTLLSVSLVRDPANEPLYFIAQLQDITDRKRAESTFHALLDSAPDAMVISNRHGRIVLVNAQARASFGYDDDELLGQPIEMLLPVRFRADHPEHRNQYFANPRERAMGVGKQLFALRKDGGEFPVEISLSPLYIDETPQVCCAIRDLTQWSHAEETRRRLSAMEHLVNHRTEMAHLLRLNTMSEMAAGIAHELNQPLSAIANYARGAARWIRRGADRTEELLAVVDSISEETVRASEIIRSIKRYLKKQEAKRVPVDIHEVIDNALRIIGGEIYDRGTELVFERCDDPLCVLGDPIELEQVVINLLSNALDALEEVPHAKFISVETGKTAEGQVEVRVADNGCGLPAVIGVNVFEAFMTTKPDGLGMGLAISRTLIEAHGGHISAEPNEYGGATFRFQLALDNGAA